MNGFIGILLLFMYLTRIYCLRDKLIIDLYNKHYNTMANNYKKIESNKIELCQDSKYLFPDLGFSYYTTEVIRGGVLGITVTVDMDKYFNVPAVIKCSPGRGYILITSSSIHEYDLCIVRIFPLMNEDIFGNEQVINKVNLEATYSKSSHGTENWFSRNNSDENICEELIPLKNRYRVSGSMVKQTVVLYLTKDKAVYIPGVLHCSYIDIYDGCMTIKYLVKGNAPEKWIEIQHCQRGYLDNSLEVYYHDKAIDC